MSTRSLSLVFVGVFVSVSSLARSPGTYLTLQDTADAGVGVGPGLKYRVDLPEIFYVDGRTGWIHCDDIDLDIVPVEFTGGIRAPVAEGWEGYVGLGVGYYLLQENRGKLDNDVGYQVYAGAEYGAADGFALFAEFRWWWLEADANAAFAANEGTGRTATLDGAGINLGVVFRF